VNGRKYYKIHIEILKRISHQGVILITNRVLVTYASRTGTTAGVADEIGKTLSDMDDQVDALQMNDVMDLSAYSAIVIGSAIQAAHWLPEALQFFQTHQSDLKNVPVAMFSVCMTLAMPNGEKYRQAVSDWVQPVRTMVTPVSEAIFAGALDVSKVPSFSDRIKFKMSVALGVWKEGDHRDWNAIRTWAVQLQPVFFGENH
jgi:menaquinone-dependent protoporphyrinogen oxidase